MSNLLVGVQAVFQLQQIRPMGMIVVRFALASMVSARGACHVQARGPRAIVCRPLGSGWRQQWICLIALTLKEIGAERREFQFQCSLLRSLWSFALVHSDNDCRHHDCRVWGAQRSCEGGGGGIEKFLGLCRRVENGNVLSSKCSNYQASAEL